MPLCTKFWYNLNSKICCIRSLLQNLLLFIWQSLKVEDWSPKGGVRQAGINCSDVAVDSISEEFFERRDGFLFDRYQGGNAQLVRDMRRFGFLFLIMLSLSLVACGDGSSIESIPAQADFPAVDPLFREFYDRLGGFDVVGPAISDKFYYEDLQCQFTAAVLMVYDSRAVGDRRFYLAPIGLKMNISEPPASPPQGSDVKYVEGHILYDKFVPLYNQLGGMLTAGKPLTELHYNPISRRFEQYFENLGFYVFEDDPAETVRLLSYGAWMCDYNCRKVNPDNGRIVISAQIDADFVDAVIRLGSHLTGFAVSAVRFTPDGYKEQVFENVALISDKNQPGRVFLRDITRKLGYLPQPPMAPKSDPTLYFYQTQAEDKGYNVPIAFMEYMAQHGGQDQFGLPIEEYALWKENIYRQCFQNICLEQHLDGPESLRIRPSPLGYYYKEMPVQAVFPAEPLQTMADATQPLAPPEASGAPPVSQTGENQSVQTESPQPTTQTFTPQGAGGQISIQVWETFPLLASGESQEIGVAVYRDNVPLRGVEPDIQLTLPDGTTRNYNMYPTGEDGQTRLTLEPIQAQNGTLIPYQVCSFFLGGEQLCVRDTFTIWNNP